MGPRSEAEALLVEVPGRQSHRPQVRADGGHEPRRTAQEDVALCDVGHHAEQFGRGQPVPPVAPSSRGAPGATAAPTHTCAPATTGKTEGAMPSALSAARQGRPGVEEPAEGTTSCP